MNLTGSTLTGQSLPSKNIVISISSIREDSWQSQTDLLASHGIKAIYFLSGQELESESSKIQYILSLGHSIGVTGWTGNDLGSSSDIVADLRRTDFALKKFGDGRDLLLRATTWNSSTADQVNAAGLGRYVGSIGIDIGQSSSDVNDRHCWSNSIDVATCVELYLKDARLRTRGIINFESSGNNSLGLIQVLIPQLKLEGFSFTTIDQVPEISSRLAKSRAFQQKNECRDREYK
ncbi:MAG: polysaccharide deacetylase family protein [Proteobacteria bacterium]|nr:polysaccharide deacetylase family protein [Pseudomonadota bacterium]